MSARTAVYLEVGDKKTFACAVEWPGWSRGARTADEALRSLVEHGRRYAAVVKGVARFTAPDDVSELETVARIEGSSGTDFGVPSHELPADKEPVDDGELRRLVGILQAAWSAFDDTSHRYRGFELRKGPRGGGRDLDKIVTHVFEAESAYRHQLGSRRPRIEPGGDIGIAMARVRETSLEALKARARGEPLADPNRVGTPWTPRYFVRRSAWHVLDHAWEIQDRAVRT